jgi:hypothetical protein
MMGSGSSEACLEAEAGHYGNETGQARQTPCRIGTYNPINGSSSIFDCKLANVGYFVPIEGQTKQTRCPPGTSQPETGQSECQLGEGGQLQTDSTPVETFQLVFLISSALMIAMGMVLLNRRTKRKGGKKTTDAMRRRYKY